MMLLCQLKRESHITVLMCLQHQHQSRNKMVGNHFVFSPTSFMFKRKQKNVVMDMKNQNSEPLKWVLVCGPRKKLKVHSKINEHIKRNIYTWITGHPQVVQSPISNNYIKVMFDDKTESQLVTKLFLH